MTARQREASSFQLPEPRPRVMAVRFVTEPAAVHLALPDVPDETLCRRAVPPESPSMEALDGPLCSTCRKTSEWVGLTCSMCGLPLFAEFDPRLCFVCTCRRREY